MTESFIRPRPRTKNLDKHPQNYPGLEHDKVNSSTGTKKAVLGTEASADTAETISTIKRSHGLLTEQLSEEEMSLFVKEVEKLLQSYKKEHGHDDEEMEDIYRGLSTVLKELADPPCEEKTFASIGSEAFELLSSRLAAKCGRISAVLRKPLDRVAAVITNHVPPLRPETDRVFIGKLRAIHATLRIHWQASHHIESIMAAPYPWLSCIMAFCYHLALAAWACFFMMDVYDFCVRALECNIRFSVVYLEVVLHCLNQLVPYALASGHSFATFVLLLVWAGIALTLQAFTEA